MNKAQWKALEYMRDGMFVPPELTKKMLQGINKKRSIGVAYSFEMLSILHTKGFEDVTLIVEERPMKYMENICTKYGYAVKTIEETKDMKFNVVLGNPPFTLKTNRGDGKLTNKSGVREFLNMAMEISEEVIMISPCHFCAPIQKSSPHWKILREKMNEFGVQEIMTIDQKKHFPTVSFHNAGIIHLSKSSNRRLEEFDNLFGEDVTFDADEYLDTQRGSSKGTYPESKTGGYNVVVRMKNDGTDDCETVQTDNARVVNSDWFVTVQEQSGAIGIRSAIVFDNTGRDWGVASNVHPLYAKTKEEAEKLSEWVKSETFNKMLMQVTRGERVLRGGWLKMLPAKEGRE